MLEYGVALVLVDVDSKWVVDSGVTVELICVVGGSVLMDVGLKGVVDSVLMDVVDSGVSVGLV